MIEVMVIENDSQGKMAFFSCLIKSDNPNDWHKHHDQLIKDEENALALGWLRSYTILYVDDDTTNLENYPVTLIEGIEY